MSFFVAFPPIRRDIRRVTGLILEISSLSLSSFLSGFFHCPCSSKLFHCPCPSSSRDSSIFPFPRSLASCETNIDHLELRLERVVRLCANMIDAGKHYSQSNGNFIAGNPLLLFGGGQTPSINSFLSTDFLSS